ncbi:MAG: ribosome biogenesis GTPase Der [Acidimicrobiia bacterium]|nr:ribosome biogenesis GTPase Der [Acidimicrobiia bacterium]MYE72823.1 ribosome biogenesis GTPase Der [Acidimicrobiia bacterium]MYJ62274.1 ribosome biogenesis GTPase Der [Acidimicrobiia bacterium]
MGRSLPTVAIVGRPNVGKSTLMNRILGRREAIVAEQPGVTRDRKEMPASWQGREFTVVDTGGWLPQGAGDNASMDAKVSAQSEKSMDDADVVVLVVDSQAGITGDDEGVAARLRGRPGPVLVAVNKVDDEVHENLIWEFIGLGLGDPFPVSALHGRGVGDLLDAVMAELPEEWAKGAQAGAEAEAETASESGTDAHMVSVSIVGRPNAGKSTLFNRLIGDDRSVVHDQPGTTRDAIDTVVETELGPIRFVDTAGMRRRARIDQATEYYSLLRALAAVDRSDIALLVVDATVGVTHQDQRLAERIDGAGCPIVVLLNKWDMLDTEAREAIALDIDHRLHFLGDAAVLRVSALSGKGLNRLLPELRGVIAEYRRRIPTQAVNRVLRDAQAAHPAPDGARVLYATQGAADPPTFTLFANRTLPRTYLRYLERRFREAFDLGSVPVKLRVRRRSGE